MPLCQRWFQQCCTSHEGCIPDKAYQSFIPTRLLDITRDRPRLCLAEEVTSVGLPVRYATLSHCWGTVAFATLNSANIDSFRQLIPPEALVKTFLDAMHVARALDFSYLWIDSLCIIQDSAEDWEREAGLMADVYGGSSLTIAASSAADGRVGCFFDRPKSWRCQVRQSDSPVLWNVFPFTLHDINGHKLRDRAWALQERYLSRRVLHFTRDQVFWECDGAPACETYPKGYPVEVYLALAEPDFDPGFALQKRPLTREAWPAIVEDYSSRRLTKKSDRFPAIGGLAKLIQEQTKDEYIAGMWMEGLEDQLTWRVKSSRYVKSSEARTLAPDAVAPYIAPSWSWASTTGHVDYPRKLNEEDLAKSYLYVEVHAIHIQFPSANPLGEIVGATLRLWCQNLYCGVTRILEEPHPTFMSFSVGDRVVIPQFWVFPDSLVASAKDTLVDTYILPIRHGMGLLRCQGLILQPTGRLKGQYRRIAAYEHVREDLSAGLLGEENLVARDCVDHFSEVTTEGGVKRYIIDLV
ncbi:HET-domain-containing protein [Coniochaeta ligniaria NRRL 30616]|uniref:HET-domain-containing protein n=1 Tax=Coniochaeta ligniaria NRRL 30616 TaxID=1408157 RepID=A0A1J7J426_9PEZI|nr:HET-domain-containing protein [Coniochaeta ligniaria NRRL 30616]